MKITRLGIDLAKNVFQIHGVDQSGKTVCRTQLTRKKLTAFIQKLEPCLISMEACSGSHHWARTFQAMGHDVRLIAPQFVKPYVKGNKNDANDAEAICEAVGRPSMRFVTIKTIEQQDIQLIHRVRSQLIKRRTGWINEVRGLLSEQGIVLAEGVNAFRQALPLLLESDESRSSKGLRFLLQQAYEEVTGLDDRIAQFDDQIARYAREPVAKRLQQLRGVGPVVATILIAVLGDGKQFRSGRDAAAWAGLVPGQHSSGGRERLMGISKRGDAYLRTQLIHGARSVVKACQGKDDPLSRWVQSLCSRRGKNVATVALANKTLRMAWALLSRGVDYDPDFGRHEEVEGQPA